MKRLYGATLAVIFALIVVHAPLQVAVGSAVPEVALGIKAWKEMLMALALIPLAYLGVRRGLVGRLRSDKLLWLIGAFVVINALSLLLWTGLESSVAGLMINLRYVVFFLLVYGYVLLFPEALGWIKRVALAGAIVVLGFGLVQLALPYDALTHIGYGPDTIRPYTTVDKNYDFIRYQSTLRGPNPYGAYAMGVALVAMAYALKRRNAAMGALSLIAAFAVYSSYSRSAFLGSAVGALIVLAVQFRRRIQPRLVATLAAVMVLALGGLWLARDSYVVSNVLLHEDPVAGSAVSSNDDHWESLARASEEAIQDPLGDGIGSTGSASLLSDAPNIVENQFLMMASEVGWLGLAVFVALWAMVLVRLWKLRSSPLALGLFASGIGLAVIGMLLPVLADDTVAIVWWGMAGAVVAYGMRQKKEVRRA